MYDDPENYDPGDEYDYDLDGPEPPDLADPDDEVRYRRERFADPEGDSALHAANERNPRILPCPTCGAERVLTPRDRAAGYQCDSCANQLEMGF